MKIRMGSLFAGIGGFDLGVEAALSEFGITCEVVFQVEFDEFCRTVLAKHWPHAIRNVTDVQDQQAIAGLPPVDLLIGGPPCQGNSSAGKGLGLEDPRSGLWFRMRDIIEDRKPPFVLVENVASGKQRYLCQMRTGLHQLGYRTRAVQVGAWEVGAPHKRERVFIFAWRGDVLADADSSALRHESERITGRWSDAVRRPWEAQPGDDGAESSALADADCVRCQLERCGRLLDGEPEQRHHTDRCGGETSAGSRGALVDSDGAGWQSRHDERSSITSERCAVVDPACARCRRRCGRADSQQAGRRESSHAGGSGTEPGLGRDADGVSAWLDGSQRGLLDAERDLYLLLDAVFSEEEALPELRHELTECWPAGRGQPQEPPRVIKKGSKSTNRRRRLKSLGNAVVPAQAAAFVRAFVAPVVSDYLRRTGQL